MALRQLSPDELVRLNLLHALPDNVRVPSRDAALLRGVSLATWQRMKARGETPRAFRVNGNAEAFEKGAVLAMAETGLHSEEQIAA